MTPTPETYLQLAAMAARRVRQYQSAGNGTAALGLGGALALVATALTGPAADWLDSRSDGPVLLMALAAAVCVVAALVVGNCRRWVRLYHAESEHWLDQVIDAERRRDALRPFLDRQGAPTPTSETLLATLGVAAVAAGLAAVAAFLAR